VVTSMLESVVKHGTGRKAAELGRPVAGKTGTTNDTHDAWFIGFTPDLLAGVWVGFDSERSLGAHETGGHAAAPIWTEFMKEALVAGRGRGRVSGSSHGAEDRIDTLHEGRGIVPALEHRGDPSAGRLARQRGARACHGGEPGRRHRHRPERVAMIAVEARGDE